MGYLSAIIVVLFLIARGKGNRLLGLMLEKILGKTSMTSHKKNAQIEMESHIPEIIYI